MLNMEHVRPLASNVMQLHAVEKLRWLKRWIFQLLVGAVMPSLRFRSRNLHLKLNLFLLIFNTLYKKLQK